MNEFIRKKLSSGSSKAKLLIRTAIALMREAWSTPATWRTRTQILSVIAILSAIIWFLSIRIGSYLDYPPQIYNDPQIYNLTQEKIKWDVFYGSSPKCGEIDCHLTSDFPKKNYLKQMVLPAREFPLSDYKSGQLIYLRTTVFLPDFMRKTPLLVIHTPKIFAERYWLYINNRLVEEGDMESLLASIPSDLLGADGRLDIAFKIDPGNLSFQGIANRSDLVIGEKAKLRPTIFLSKDLSSNLFLWFLLPRITFCTMFAFFFITMSRTRDIYAFVLYAFLGALELFFRSEYASTMLPWDVKWNFLGMLSRNFSTFAFVSFIYCYFRLNDARFNRILALGVGGQIVLAILCFTVIPYKAADTMTDLIIVLLKPASLAFAAFISIRSFHRLRASQDSKIRMQSALLLSVVFLFWFVVSLFESTDAVLDMLGYNAGGLVRKTWLVDLAFFFVLAALTAIEIGASFANKRAIEAELRALEERLELGRMVQNLLLPESLIGEFNGAKYQFFYEPAQKMSGDWLNIWKTETGECRLFVGDVVGKGPQAALAVAAIASSLSECRDAQLSMSDTIARINHRLIELFHGTVGTTLTAISLDAHMKAELYTCGALGWIVFADNVWDYVPLRGSSLGVDAKITVSTKIIQLKPNNTLIAFTDGCLEGSRALKVLFKQLKLKNIDPGSKLDLHREIISVGQTSVVEDDKTMLIISL